MKSKSIIFFSGLLWLINPIFSGCSPDQSDTDWQFDESDLQAMLDDINSEPIIYEESAQSFEIHLNLQPVIQETEVQEANGKYHQSPHLQIEAIALQSAHACDTAVFFASAQACIDMAIMYVEGTIEIRDTDSQEVLLTLTEISGEFNTSSEDLSSGYLWLSNNGNIHISMSDHNTDGDMQGGLDWTIDSIEW